MGAAAVIGIVVSGLRFILANGDSGSIATARSGLIFSLVGVVVVILALYWAQAVFIPNRIRAGQHRPGPEAGVLRRSD